MEEEVRDWNLFKRYLAFLSVFIVALISVGYIYQTLLFKERRSIILI